MPEEKSHSLKFPKSHRLTGKITIDRLYKSGTSVKVFPLKLIYIERNDDHLEPLQSLMAVPKRNHKKAVDRNRLKRCMREAYRHLMHGSITKIKNSNQSYAIMFVYLGKNIDEYQTIYRSMKTCLEKFNLYLDEKSRS